MGSAKLHEKIELPSAIGLFAADFQHRDKTEEPPETE